MIHEKRLVQTFLSLVQIDSETKNEQHISQYLQSTLRDLGFHVEEDDTAEKTGHGSGNLCCMLPAQSSNIQHPTIFFTCHMDTVSPGKGIKPVIGEDRIIRSDGTTILGSDDKAGIAALLEALQVIQENQVPHGAIQLIFTAGEESGLKGARAMERSQLKAEYGYALDSNGQIGHIAKSAPGKAEIRITFEGKTAHAGVNPEDGISAIQVASKAVSHMPLGRIDQETTANIGSFYGHSPINIVCDQVTIEAEARSLNLNKLHKQIDAMRHACEEASNQSGGKVQFEAHVVWEPFTVAEDQPVFELVRNAMKRIGIIPHPFSTGGGSDANIFNGMGVPTLNLAIGYQAIHTVREHIAISDLVKTSELVLAIIRETARHVTALK